MSLLACTLLLLLLLLIGLERLPYFSLYESVIVLERRAGKCALADVKEYKRNASE